MIRTETLDRYGGLDCLGYTYPRFRNSLMMATPDGLVAAVKGSVDGKTAGLVLAHIDPEQSVAVIASLYVVPEFRRRSLARQMMEHLERDLRRRGLKRAELGYLEKPGNASAMQRILTDLEWEPPQPERLVCCADQRIFEAKWLKRRLQLPDHFELFPWAELRTEERDALLASQADDPWINPMVDPFKCDAAVGFNSVGLRYNGAVVGWLVTNYFDSETLSYTCSYIRPDLQPSGYIIALYAEAIRRQYERVNEYPKARWVVPYIFPTMIRFVRVGIQPYAISTEDFKVTRKHIALKASNSCIPREEPACTAI